MGWWKLKREDPGARPPVASEANVLEVPSRPACACGLERAALELQVKADAIAVLVRAEWHEAGVEASVKASLLLARVAEECEGLAAIAAKVRGSAASQG